MSIKSTLIAFWEWLDFSGEQEAAARKLRRETHERAMQILEEYLAKFKAERAKESRRLIAVACCDEMEHCGLTASKSVEFPMANNECPFCGGEVEVSNTQHYPRPLALNEGPVTEHRPRCCMCNSQGPVFYDLTFAPKAIHAFCHPAHLTAGIVGKAVIDVQIAKEVRQMVADTCPDCDGDEYCRTECDGGCPWIELTAALEPIPTPPPVQTGMVMVSVEDAALILRVMDRQGKSVGLSYGEVTAHSHLTAAIEASKEG